MRLHLHILFLFITVCAFSQTVEKEDPFRPKYYFSKFPGGKKELNKFLSANIKYPASAQERRVNGKVVANFTVNKIGEITNVRIAQSLDSAYDNEVLRVIKQMPRFIPGKARGVSIPTVFIVPFYFRTYGAPDDNADTTKMRYYTPVFPGGINKFESYLINNIKRSCNTGQSKTLRASFKISETGRISDIGILFSADSCFTRSVIQTLEDSPQWIQKEGTPLDVDWELNISYYTDSEIDYLSSYVFARDIDISGMLIRDNAIIEIDKDTFLSEKIQILDPVLCIILPPLETNPI
ncbi:energy transducer TonB [Dysgonomonas sp. 521]|uniref:energy transducer TonB n=1 Tax=Dysgonomonas sp. 521 TaxID=2302932 RepID=UPI0013D81742|nr:energy transducer TonB [Dysgonomonas sp. 521]NDV95230.1 energy transducer TonB [Dysgonomonas sp. 521]